MADEQDMTEGSKEGNIADFVKHTDFFGHPRGLSTLFFTEFWERFSYYGMRALLVLFMVASIKSDNPGLGLTDSMATAIYGIYTFFVYTMALPGGWVADNIWGQRKSVFIGGCIIALGHFTMAAPLIGLPPIWTFYLGLFFITIGTGLLKPNVSVMVGGLYPEGGARRDAGFSIFYMGINFGAIFGPTLTSILGETYNWHWGFSLAGFGMVIGLIWYKLGSRYLGDIGTFNPDYKPKIVSKLTRRFYIIAAVFIAAVIVIGWLIGTGIIPISIEELALFLGMLVALIAVIYFTYLILDIRWIIGILVFTAALVAIFMSLVGLDFILAFRNSILFTVLLFLAINVVKVLLPKVQVSRKNKRLMVIFWLFILAALFWAGFEQAGVSLNLFAERYTDRFFGPVGLLEGALPIILTAIVAVFLAYVCYRVFKKEVWPVIQYIIVIGCAAIVLGVYFLLTNIAVGWEMPASMLQNINPLWIVILAPVFGSLWVWLAKRNTNPSIPVKFGLGLILLAGGFFVISWGAAVNTGASEASAGWLVVTYFLFTCGELSLSPVGLSSMTKLAPEGKGSQMMGIWFVGSALGSLFAGLIAGQLGSTTPTDLFWILAVIIAVGGFIALLVSPFVKNLMGDVE